MKNITLNNDTELSLSFEIGQYHVDKFSSATPSQCDDAEDYASDKYRWMDGIDPDNTTPFDETPYDDRVALALMVIVDSPESTASYSEEVST
ncbi:MAG: hypothetical protein IPH35_19650 [Rhodoferax sp.]|nr:hypothetical protein [Rhodoferax sp.]